MATNKKAPIPIIIIAGFSLLCAVGLSVFAVAMVMANTKLIGVAIFALLGVILLIVGVYQLVVKHNRAVLLIPLCIVLAIGCVGETIDALGNATIASDAIGFGILLLFAIPVILLLMPTSRKWSSSNA